MSSERRKTLSMRETFRGLPHVILADKLRCIKIRDAPAAHCETTWVHGGQSNKARTSAVIIDLYTLIIVRGSSFYNTRPRKRPVRAARQAPSPVTIDFTSRFNTERIGLNVVLRIHTIPKQPYSRAALDRSGGGV